MCIYIILTHTHMMGYYIKSCIYIHTYILTMAMLYSCLSFRNCIGEMIDKDTALCVRTHIYVYLQSKSIRLYVIKLFMQKIDQLVISNLSNTYTYVCICARTVYIYMYTYIYTNKLPEHMSEQQFQNHLHATQFGDPKNHHS